MFLKEMEVKREQRTTAGLFHLPDVFCPQFGERFVVRVERTAEISSSKERHHINLLQKKDIKGWGTMSVNKVV